MTDNHYDDREQIKRQKIWDSDGSEIKYTKRIIVRSVDETIIKHEKAHRKKKKLRIAEAFMLSRKKPSDLKKVKDN